MINHFGRLDFCFGDQAIMTKSWLREAKDPELLFLQTKSPKEKYQKRGKKNNNGFKIPKIFLWFCHFRLQKRMEIIIYIDKSIDSWSVCTSDPQSSTF